MIREEQCCVLITYVICCSFWGGRNTDGVELLFLQYQGELIFLESSHQVSGYREMKLLSWCLFCLRVFTCKTFLSDLNKTIWVFCSSISLSRRHWRTKLCFMYSVLKSLRLPAISSFTRSCFPSSFRLNSKSPWTNSKVLCIFTHQSVMKLKTFKKNSKFGQIWVERFQQLPNYRWDEISQIYLVRSSK